MKKVLIILMMATYVIAGPHYYVSTGISNPYAPDDFQKYWHSGYTLAAGMGWQFNNFEVMPNLAFENLSLDDTGYLGKFQSDEDFAYASVSDGATSIFSLLVDAKYFSPTESTPNFIPYLFASAGLGVKTIAKKEVYLTDDSFIEDKDSQMVPMLGAGIGFEVVAGGRTNVTIQIQGNMMFTEEITFYVPIRVGIAIK